MESKWRVAAWSWLVFWPSMTGACGSDRTSELTEPSRRPAKPQDTQSAVKTAYSAMRGGAPEAITNALVGLDETVSEQPADGLATFYSGALRVLQIAELHVDPLVEPEIALTALSRLERAHTLRPSDYRVPAFLGLVRMGVANALDDPDMAEQALSELQEAIDGQPQYGHFLRACAVAGLPANDPLFETYALDGFFMTMQACGLTDDTDPLLFHHPDEALPYPRNVCHNWGIVPHVWEGFFTAFGDVALKAGRPTAEAVSLYENARTAPSYDRWPFRDELERRINHVEKRAALYHDDDSSNDPKVWTVAGHACAGCHQD